MAEFLSGVAPPPPIEVEQPTLKLLDFGSVSRFQPEGFRA
jgi:hypothetical protein